MYTLHPDVYIARRSRLHFVVDTDGDLAWSGKSLMSAFEFLDAIDQNEFEITTEAEGLKFHVMIRPD